MIALPSRTLTSYVLFAAMTGRPVFESTQLPSHDVMLAGHVGITVVVPEVNVK